MEKQKQRLAEISEEILQYLLKFKEENEDFTFTLRQRNNGNNELESGLFFNGSSKDGKIAVGFLNSNNGRLATPLLAFVIVLNEDGEIIDNYIYVRVSDELSKVLTKAIEEILSEIEIQSSKESRRSYPNRNNYLSNLYDYMTKIRLLCLKIIKKYKLENELLIPEEVFKKNLDKILEKRKEYLNMNNNNNSNRMNAEEIIESDSQSVNAEDNRPRNLILYGPPGTGKTYNAIDMAMKIAYPSVYADYIAKKINRKKFTDKFRESLIDFENGTGQIAFTTFHQSMSYEDFIEGIKPILNDNNSTSSNNSNITYNIQSGIFKKICIRAQSKNNFEKSFSDLVKYFETNNNALLTLKTPTGKSFKVKLNRNFSLNILTGPKDQENGSMTQENLMLFSQGIDNFRGWQGYAKGVLDHLRTKYRLTAEENIDKNYVLIIDEINRGNISQIFGELITLIEESKRSGKQNEEELKVILPYSKATFSVPFNLYIVGTMNTADRSVEALDSALRRRFSFVEMMPDASEINPAEIHNTGIDLQQLLTKINERLEVLLSKEHTIGHTYLLGIKNIADLKHAFNKKIIPLLKEYFYGDFGKISMVIGVDFVNQNSNKSTTNKSLFMPGYSDMIDEYSEVKPWKFQPIEEMDENAFIKAVKNIYA